MRLRRPLVLTAADVAVVHAGYTLAETGAFLVLATAWWPEGVLPSSTRRAAALLNTRPSIAKRMLAQFRPLFEPSGRMGLLRAAHIAKAKRRGRAGKAALAARAAKRARAEKIQGQNVE